MRIYLGGSAVRVKEHRQRIYTKFFTNRLLNYYHILPPNNNDRSQWLWLKKRLSQIVSRRRA